MGRSAAALSHQHAGPLNWHVTSLVSRASPGLTNPADRVGFNGPGLIHSDPAVQVTIISLILRQLLPYNHFSPRWSC